MNYAIKMTNKKTLIDAILSSFLVFEELNELCYYSLLN